MRLEHPIFHTPHEVQVPLHEVEAPTHYEHYSLEPVPARLQAWRVFERPAPPPGVEPGPTIDLVGLVSDGFGFEDSPDCEWISSGINSKGPTALALGRQASYFLWGFAAPPSLLTPSARDVLVNAVVYMRQFEGQRPLVRGEASPREWVGVEVWAAEQAGEDPAYRDPGQAPEEAVSQALTRYFGEQTVARVGADPGALRAWFLDHIEQVTSVRGEDGWPRHQVDEDLIELGASNRRLELFDRLLARWRSDPEDPLCGRVLDRYVPDVQLASPDELERWLATHRERLFFSDAGGFRWFVADRPLPRAAEPAPPAPPQEADGEHVRVQAALALPTDGNGVATLRVALTFDEGWHGYTPSSPAGFPLRLALEPSAGLTPEGELLAPPPSSQRDTAQGVEQRLAGRVTFSQRYRLSPDVEAPSVRVVASVIVCDERQCLPPQQLELTVEPTRR